MDFTFYPITIDDTGRRIDRVIRRFLPDVPLSGVYRLLRTGMVRVNGKKVRPADMLPPDAVIGIARHLAPDQDNREGDSVNTGEIRPYILLESPDLLFLNKIRGMPVHGPGGLDHLVPPSPSETASLSFRSGPLHRLDKDTSGIVTFSRTLLGARWFTEALSSHRMGKYYLGIVRGQVSSSFEWRDIDDDGKEMITLVAPVAGAQNESGTYTSLLQYRILTGKKHQIRKQSEIHGCPLDGDSRYGGGKRDSGYFLHAWQLHFPEDRPAGIPEFIAAPLPRDMRVQIGLVFGENVLAKLDTLNVY
jgi:23S rRNA pseudouridine955/2504/2580 synthase